MWLTIVHMAFVFSALLLAYIDRVMNMTKSTANRSDGLVLQTDAVR